MSDRIHAGNIYVNRNQIGAIVGSQPFGGEGLSGTGPKAGGPHYLPRFGAPDVQKSDGAWTSDMDIGALSIAGCTQPRDRNTDLAGANRRIQPAQHFGAGTLAVHGAG